MKFLPFLLFVFLITVSCKDNTVTYDACGYFEAEEWTVVASAAGKVIAFDVEEGSNVAAGMQIGLIDTVYMQLQKELLLLQPKSKVRDIQEKQINYQLKQCIITAVASGIVAEKYAKRGEMVAVGYPLIKIANIENMYLRIYITSAQMRSIKIGQEVEITLDNGDDVASYKYKGKIEWISSAAEFTPKTIQTEDERQNMVYAVKIAVKNDGSIKTGSYAEVKF
jgi:HlyD family secretion protein